MSEFVPESTFNNGKWTAYLFDDDPTRHGLPNEKYYRELILGLAEKPNEHALNAIAKDLADSDRACRYIRLKGFHPSDELGIWELVKKVLP